jgi:NitT/TauT family transport system permease protein
MPGTIFTPLARGLRVRLSWRDLVVFAGFFGVVYGMFHVIRAVGAPFRPGQEFPISLEPAALPGYAFRSLVRMYAAYALSLAFALVSGRVAAYNRRAEQFIIPFLDIMQSVPVLGFLSVAVTGFLTLLPGQTVALELASIIAIFSSQAWNIAFSWYQSLKTLPKDLTEAAANYGLNDWQRFTKLELPFATTGLVWNSMMSFGSGWFFLAASEAITVLNQNYKLPGLGSFMAVAVEQKNVPAVLWGIAAYVVVIVVVDQLFWRPVVAWSERFRMERRGEEATSAVLNLVRESTVGQWLGESVLEPLGRRLNRLFSSAHRRSAARGRAGAVWLAARWVAGLGVAAWIGWTGLSGLAALARDIHWTDITTAVVLGFATLGRIAAVVALSSLIWVPVGVRIGFNPRLARVAQPLVQLGASFPANVVFPLITFIYVLLNVDLNWGSILLLMAGTQWYVLFNVIAGAMQVPSDIRDASRVFRLRGWHRWRRLILPAIFPAWVTGALTAAGGAWNASIVAEVTNWGKHRLWADGLGAEITRTTEAGDWTGIVVSIAIMCAYVVVLNKLVWQPLYAVSEERFRAQ